MSISFVTWIGIGITLFTGVAFAADAGSGTLDIRELDRDREIKAADAMLNDPPITVAASRRHGSPSITTFSPRVITGGPIRKIRMARISSTTASTIPTILSSIVMP